MNALHKALNTYRQNAELYVDGKIEWQEFWESFAEIMAPFDPLDWSLESLSEEQKKEVLFYYEWHGGEFGEFEERIPKNKNWKYGESKELYGWIDMEVYYDKFSLAFNNLKNEIGI